MNKTLKEKRKELIQKYKKEWDIPESQKVWWDKIFIDVEKQDKEFIDDILEEMEKIKQRRFDDIFKNRKGKTELNKEFSMGIFCTLSYFIKKIKQKAGEFK